MKERIIFLFCLSFLYLIFNLMWWTQPYEDTTEKINCYDEMSHKIIGLECERKYFGYSLELKIGLTIGLTVLSLFLLYFNMRIEPR